MCMLYPLHMQNSLLILLFFLFKVPTYYLTDGRDKKNIIVVRVGTVTSEVGMRCIII